MLINGKPPVASGTLVIREGESASIIIYGMQLDIQFTTDEGVPRSEVVGNTLKIINSDNALGTHAGFQGAIMGTKVQGSFAVYYIGDGNDGVRVMHYTVTAQ